jgi:tRNA A-37 threonylcarbamoyl transferase component Bud32
MQSLRHDDTSDQTKARAVPPPGSGNLAVGTELMHGNYVIEDFLARGGMGEVYRARHIHEEDRYAIKIIVPEIARDETVIELFRREAQALKRVNSDAIVRYRDFLSVENGAHCLIMEFVDGESLAKVLQRRRFEPEEVLALLRRIGRGLGVVHDLGIVHRDISPDNIILPDGDIERAKLIDFGIAKSADPSTMTLIGNDFAGKMSFASPEQADPDRFDRVVDRRSDIYSLGLVLAAAALGFGNKLNMGGSLANVVKSRQSVPDLGELPASLRPLISHMLQPRPQDRPASMSGAIEEAAARAPPSRARPKAPKRRLPVGRQLIWLAGTAMAAAAAAVVAVLVVRQVVAPSVGDLRGRIAAILSGYQCADLSYAVGADRTAAVSGYVRSDDDLAGLRQQVAAVNGLSSVGFDVHRRIWPYCAAAALLKPYLARGSKAATLRLAAAAAPPSVGSPLVLNVQAPPFDGYVYIDYFRSDGEVRHLFPNAKDWFNLRPARNRFVLGRPPMQDCWMFAGRPGEQMITLVASRRPLFGSPLPAAETAGDYLPRLVQALRSGAAGGQSAAMLLYDLRPGAAPPGGADRCSGR